MQQTFSWILMLKLFLRQLLKNICEAAEIRNKIIYSSGSRVVMYCSEMFGNLLLHDVLLSTWESCTWQANTDIKYRKQTAHIIIIIISLSCFNTWKAGWFLVCFCFIIKFVFYYSIVSLWLQSDLWPDLVGGFIMLISYHSSPGNHLEIWTLE